MIKFVSMNEDLVSSMNLLGEEVEPAVAVKDNRKTGMPIVSS